MKMGDVRLLAVQKGREEAIVLPHCMTCLPSTWHVVFSHMPSFAIGSHVVSSYCTQFFILMISSYMSILLINQKKFLWCTWQMKIWNLIQLMLAVSILLESQIVNWVKLVHKIRSFQLIFKKKRKKLHTPKIICLATPVREEKTCESSKPHREVFFPCKPKTLVFPFACTHEPVMVSRASDACAGCTKCVAEGRR